MTDSITIKEFNRLRTLGKKYCPIHPPKGDRPGEIWEICMAGFHKGECGLGGHYEAGHDTFKLVVNEPDLQYFRDIRAYYDRPLGDRDADAFAVHTERVFLTLDICGSSRINPPENQAIVLSEVIDVAEQILARGTPATLERQLNTGDGFVLVFHTSHVPEPWPLRLAQELARALVERNLTRGTINFRISLSRGLVFLTRELDGKTNYIGPAITEGRRLLEKRDPSEVDVIFFDEGIRKAHERYLSEFRFHPADTNDKFGVRHSAFRLEF